MCWRCDCDLRKEEKREPGRNVASFLWRPYRVVPTRGDVIDAATSQRWWFVQTTFDVRDGSRSRLTSMVGARGCEAGCEGVQLPAPLRVLLAGQIPSSSRTFSLASSRAHVTDSSFTSMTHFSLPTSAGRKVPRGFGRLSSRRRCRHRCGRAAAPERTSSERVMTSEAHAERVRTPSWHRRHRPVP